jgi:hypothetical protein
MKTYFKIVGWFIGITALLSITVLGVKILLFPAHVANTAANTAYAITDKTLNADNVIYNYEWFKRQYNDYLAINNKVKNAEQAVKDFNESAGSREKWTFEDKTESARLQSIVTGIKQQRQDIVAEYNAKSQMANRSIFKTGDLPEQL